jgi:serine/threonine-protein kinase
MILTYAISSQQLAAGVKVIVPMGAGTHGGSLGSWGWPILSSTRSRFRATNLEQISEHGLFVFLGAFTAIFGTHHQHLADRAYAARSLNQYRLQRKLGGGRHGRGLSWRSIRFQATVRVKLIRQERSGDAHAMARFEREVRATALLSLEHHRDLDYGRNHDGAFYYDGIPARPEPDVLAHRHGPAAAGVIYLLRQTCDGARGAHEGGPDPP